MVHLKGTYDHKHQIIVTNREHASGPGHWLLTPLKLDGIDQHVIVSRGFIPFADREPDTWSKYNFAELDEFDAVVKLSSSQTMFGPSNPKASPQKPFPTMYFYPDIGNYAQQLPYPVVRSVFFQRIGKPPVGEFPAQSILVEVPPQTHFGYTIEWALLGFATLTIGFLVQAFPRQRRLKFKQIPLLGICLGMQLLTSYSYEHGEHEGLGIIPGVVKKLPTSAPGIKVPHVGWNDTFFVKESPLCQGLKKSEVFYFVHSYYVEPEDGESILATTDYACNFASALAFKNVFATQFHPEKSQRVGIRILKNFFDICKLGE